MAASTYFPFGENFAKDTGGLPACTMVRMQCPVSASHTLQSPSKLLETTCFPSELKSTAVMGSEWAGRSLSSLPVLTSQSLTVSSKLPLASRLDCALNAQQNTKCVCPFSTFTHFPSLLVSHSRKVRSSDALQRYLELVDQATLETPMVCPFSTISGCFVASSPSPFESFSQSHTHSVRSAEALASLSTSRRSADVLRRPFPPRSHLVRTHLVPSGENFTMDTARSCPIHSSRSAKRDVAMPLLGDVPNPPRTHHKFWCTHHTLGKWTCKGREQSHGWNVQGHGKVETFSKQGRKGRLDAWKQGGILHRAWWTRQTQGRGIATYTKRHEAFVVRCKLQSSLDAFDVWKIRIAFPSLCIFAWSYQAECRPWKRKSPVPSLPHKQTAKGQQEIFIVYQRFESEMQNCVAMYVHHVLKHKPSFPNHGNTS